MRRAREGLRRTWTAAFLLLRDLSRRRIALLLLFAVPALFDGVVLATTASREVQVTFGALVEPGAQVRTPEAAAADPFDTSLDDDGSRKVDERKLSLVFLGQAAVSFLACFLAFNLVHKRRDVDARLVLAGYRAHEVLLAKVIVLLLLVLVLACYETAILRPWVIPTRTAPVVIGLIVGGLTYGCLGLLVGSLAKHELEGVFAIVLLTNVDVGWLQNPIYFAHSQSPALIRALPGYGAAQLAVVGAFTGAEPRGVLWRACLWAGAALVFALVSFGSFIAPPRPNRSARARMRSHYAKVLGASYLLWFVSFEAVGRFAAGLHTIDPTSFLDRALPLVPAFVWPYEACYLLPVLSLFVVRNWHRFNVAVLAILVANVTAFVAYVTLPIAFAHPSLGAGLSERVLALEYAADFHPGANKLPSMHVAMSWIMVRAMSGQTQSRVFDAGLTVFLLLVTVAPVFVKQHLVVDVGAGVPWGLAAYWAAERWYERVVRQGESAPEGLARAFAPWRQTAP
jgi:hypothetical protein